MTELSDGIIVYPFGVMKLAWLDFLCAALSLGGGVYLISRTELSGYVWLAFGAFWLVHGIWEICGGAKREPNPLRRLVRRVLKLFLYS